MTTPRTSDDARRRLQELREELDRMPADLMATAGPTRERLFRRLAEIRQEVIDLYGETASH